MLPEGQDAGSPRKLVEATCRQIWNLGARTYFCFYCRSKHEVKGWASLYEIKGEKFIYCQKCQQTNRLLDMIGKDP
jgi:hypothetical protein